MNSTATTGNTTTPAFLAGNSEMQRLTREFDWSKTALGPVHTWPQSLCNTLGILLRSKFPMFLFWGPEHICFYNDAYRPSMGKAGEGKHPAALGQRALEAWAEVWDVVQPQLQLVMDGGEATWHEDHLIPIYRNGRLEDSYWTYSFGPVLGDEGNIEGVLVTTNETNKKVYLQQQLTESEKRFERLSNTVPAMIFFLDAEERYQSYNQRFMDWYNVGETEVIGKTVQEFLGEKAYAIIQPHLQKAFNGEPEQFEMPAPSRLNGAGWLNITYTPQREADGTISGITVLATDATAHKNVELALRSSEEKYRTLFTTMDQGFCIIKLLFDDKGKPVDYLFQEANPVFGGQTGLVDPVGKTAKELVPGLEDKWFKIYGAVATTGEAIRFVDGSEPMRRWFEVYAFRIGEAAERRIAVLFTDITERKLAENKLRENETLLQNQVETRTKDLAEANDSLQSSNKELLRSNQSLEEFAHAASHDLKEPVRKISYFTEQLKEQLSSRLNENETRIFGRIENATSRMGALIDDLLLYSHVSQRPLEKEEVDLNQKLTRVLEDLELDILQKEAVIEIGPLCVVLGYRRQLQQLFQNLISNALKYTAPGVPPHITISCQDVERNDRSYHCFSVRDEGIGFEQEYADKIFGMFTRLHGKHEYSGTGVGLSIVKKVVDNHEGFIEVESTPGQGATFKVFLPA